MKRFFATVGFSFLFALILLNNFLSDYAFIFLIVSVLFAGVLFLLRDFEKKNEIICVLFSFVFATLSFMLFNKYVYKPQLKLCGSEYEISATVLDYPSKSSGGNFSYLIKTNEIGGEKRKLKMRLYTPSDISAEPYDEISFTSSPFLIGENNNEILSYFKGKGTYLGVYTGDDISVEKPSQKPLISFFTLRKGRSESLLRKTLDGDFAEFSVSILFGDKTYLSTEIKDSFSLSGLSHITAVSGLHMSVWVMGLYFLLKKLKLKEKLCGALCIIASVSLVFFCAFSVSVIRAAVMMTIYFSASFFRRRPDSLNSLGFAAFLICAVNPFSVCDVSFLLSFFATLGIITGADVLPVLFRREKKKSILKRMRYYILSCVSVCVFANLFTAPVLLKYYSSLNTYVLLGNIAVSFVLPVCLLLSGALSVFGEIHIIAYPLKSLLTAVIKYIFLVTGEIGSLPLSRVVSYGDVFTLYLPLFFIFSFFAVYCVKKKKITPTAALCALSLTLILF